MRLFKIHLDNSPQITIEYGKTTYEFDNVDELQASGIISDNKLRRLIDSISDATRDDISHFDFNL